MGSSRSVAGCSCSENGRGKAGNLTKRRGGRVVPRRFLLSHQVSRPELVGRKRLSRYFVYRATRMPCAATPISARNATWSPRSNATWSPRIYWTAKRCSRLPVPGRLSKVVLPSVEWPSAAERCSSVSEGRCRRARPSRQGSFDASFGDAPSKLSLHQSKHGPGKPYCMA
jgi:hypothetical protein